jgi:5'-nucleotidase/UDP-sugar diphosphatase
VRPLAWTLSYHPVMRHRHGSLTALVLAAAALVIGCTPPAPEAESPALREVTLLYTNDFESAYDPIPAFWRDDLDHVGGVAQLATLIDEVRAEEKLSFLLDAGDIFTGTLAKLTRGELPFELMITMGYDAMCIGNHEFEYGWWVLRDAMQRAPFPVLAANLFYDGTDIPFTQQWTILERDGFRIGVVGIFGQDAATALFPPHLEGLEVRDPVAAARTAVARLRDEVDLVVLLTHEGKTAPMQTDDEADPAVHRDIDADIALAGAVPGVDVLIGGHADAGQETPFIHPVTGTLICQTYGQGTRLGYLKLLIDPDSGEVVGHDGRLLVVASDELEPQPVVAAKLAAYRARFPEVDETVGRTAERLTRRYNEESDLGDLFADILRAHGGTDIAFVHSGGIRADLPAGDVTREDLLDAFPFIDFVTTLRMTGAQILDVLEQAFSLERGVLQVSGMTVTYDLDRPVGERVVAVTIGGEPLDPGAIYTVTTLDFLASGADLYSGFLDAEIVQAQGPEFAELLVARFAAGEPVAAPEGGRLILLSNN